MRGTSQHHVYSHRVLRMCHLAFKLYSKEILIVLEGEEIVENEEEDI